MNLPSIAALKAPCEEAWTSLLDGERHIAHLMENIHPSNWKT